MIILDTTKDLYSYTNNYEITPEMLSKMSQWLIASDAFSKAMLDRFHFHNEDTAIAYRAGKEKFEIVDRELNELAEGDSELIKILMIEVFKSNDLSKSNKKKRSG